MPALPANTSISIRRILVIVTYIALLISFLAISTASAQELNGITIEPAEIAVGQSVQIQVDMKNQGSTNAACGVYIAFGDGTSERIRVDASKLPLKITHTYARVGNFAVSVEGNLQVRGLSSVLPCFGSTRTSAVNVRPEDFVTKEAAEQAAQEAAFKKAASERQAADRATRKATADRIAAEKAAERAASERSRAEKAAAAGATARGAAEKESARSAALQRAAEKESADRIPIEQGASPKAAEASIRPRQPAVEAPQKAIPAKARSAMDL